MPAEPGPALWKHFIVTAVISSGHAKADISDAPSRARNPLNLMSPILPRFEPLGLAIILEPSPRGDKRVPLPLPERYKILRSIRIQALDSPWR